MTRACTGCQSLRLSLSAIRKPAAEAAENGLLDRSVAQGIVSLKDVRRSGSRAGNWLTREQASYLLAQHRHHRRKTATVRFWRCFSAVLCAGANSRRPSADTDLKSFAIALEPSCGRLSW